MDRRSFFKKTAGIALAPMIAKIVSVNAEGKEVSTIESATFETGFPLKPGIDYTEMSLTMVLQDPLGYPFALMDAGAKVEMVFVDPRGREVRLPMCIRNTLEYEVTIKMPEPGIYRYQVEVQIKDKVIITKWGEIRATPDGAVHVG